MWLHRTVERTVKSMRANRMTHHKTSPNDLLFKILRAGDHLVALAPQLTTNRTSNLALVLYVHES